MTHKAVLDKPECYHAVCMYSCDACSSCKYDMDCYQKFMDYLLKS